MHNVRHPECRKTFLSRGGLVGAGTVQDSFREHDENRAEGFGVEGVAKYESGQVTAVADEEWLLDVLGFHPRVTVLPMGGGVVRGM